MPQSITDADEFTDPMEAPQDGEAATGASLVLIAQGAANRTRYLNNRLEELPAFSVSDELVYGRYDLPPAGFNDDDLITMTAAAQSGGFTLGSGTNITVPDTGLYLVLFHAVITCGDAGDELQREIELEINAALVGTARGTRFKNAILAEFPLQAFGGVFAVTSGQVIRLRANSFGDPGGVVVVSGQVSVARIK